ncbi:hypothetical protein K0M31_013650, partial [Melipona bicolor]
MKTVDKHEAIYGCFWLVYIGYQNDARSFEFVPGFYRRRLRQTIQDTMVPTMNPSASSPRKRESISGGGAPSSTFHPGSGLREFPP